MDISEYTARLREDLVAAAALGDEKTQATAAALATATENAARLTLLAALSDLAAEVSAELGDRTVHIALEGTTAKVDVRKNTQASDEETPSFEDITGDISRVTLRMVDQIKTRAQQAAEQSGMSLNSWLSTTVQDALRDQTRWGGGGRRDE
ncbi:hypothetical protein [Nocardia macrotermitis]|uniref:HicB family protein n=1 Tax=Nocardia macrotermitis TaxID=2585198 RepID=A0A7K0CZA4_9NOCA|nr:hypothetical protein [Nocardia macrotermitis]MQY18813.1 hypothetical protein [Nocardia macrotermitis]